MTNKVKNKEFTEELYQKIKDTNSKENPFNIDNYNKNSILRWNKKYNYISQHKLYISFTCKCCNKISYRVLNKHLQDYMLHFCGNCNRIKTVKDKYNVDFVSQLEESKIKQKQTNLEKYGTEHPMQSKQVKEKIKNTVRERYGVDSIFELEETKEKARQTCLERYGVEYIMQSDEFKDKIKATCLERYGHECYASSDDIKEKRRQTNLKKYGVENPFQSEEVKEKIKQTNIERYGVENPSQSEEVKEKIKNSLLTNYGSFFNKYVYQYNDIKFDSSWELAFYIYHKDKEHNIIRNVTKCFSYKADNEIHEYYPDFKLNNKYIEIKGDQFIEFYKNGNPKTFKNPFDETYNQQMAKAKYNCMKKNNVKLIYSKQIKKYLDYIIDKYGSLDYLEQFKI